jgi:hypothetical protein
MRIRRTDTGQVSVTDESHGSAVTFVTSIYGGPVVMVTGAMQVFVDRAVTARCGDLVADPHGWVARFWHDAVTA